MVTKKFKFLYKMIKADKSASNSLNPSIFEGLVTLCAPDAVCFSRHIPHASGRILAERFLFERKFIAISSQTRKCDMSFFIHITPFFHPFLHFHVQIHWLTLLNFSNKSF